MAGKRYWLAAIVLLTLTSCAGFPELTASGYEDACNGLPGLIGDDC